MKCWRLFSLCAIMARRGLNGWLRQRGALRLHQLSRKHQAAASATPSCKLVGRCLPEPEARACTIAWHDHDGYLVVAAAYQRVQVLLLMWAHLDILSL